ncbi:MAG: nucleotidyltransferase domain-containing protein [Desulfacinum sp.]|jgi:predicted nucleotidyltransferase|nr:nucleotidyltransferase domain-containing protein [Desulfacinum sp.]MBZ4659162.1 nucleotidyltransferase protein [Desulfacinum sp.]
MTERTSSKDRNGTTVRDRLERIAQRFAVADIYAFGSRAKAAVRQLDAREPDPSFGSSTSDLDLGVRPFPGVRLSAQGRVELTIALEDLFGVPRVDLVVLPEADPYLALDVVRGELLYTADPDEEARYQLYVLRRAADLAPFKKERIRMILEEGAR